MCNVHNQNRPPHMNTSILLAYYVSVVMASADSTAKPGLRMTVNISPSRLFSTRLSKPSELLQILDASLVPDMAPPLHCRSSKWFGKCTRRPGLLKFDAGFSFADQGLVVSVRFSGENKSHWSSLEFPNLDWSMSFKLRQLDSVCKFHCNSVIVYY